MIYRPDEVVGGVIAILVLMPLLGFAGAFLLNLAIALAEHRRIDYWKAYRIATFGGMASVLPFLPLQLVTIRLGLFGLIVDAGVSTLLMAIINGHWVPSEKGEPIGFSRALPISVLEAGLWLLVGGVIFGLSLTLTPAGRVMGAFIACGSVLLLYIAGYSGQNPGTERRDRASPVAILDWDSDDVVDLYRYALAEFERGDIDALLWADAASQRAHPADQKEWYLAARTQQLREIALAQLRREGR